MQPDQAASSPSPPSPPSPPAVTNLQDEQSSPADRSPIPQPSIDPSIDNEPTEPPANPTTDEYSRESPTEEQAVRLTADEQQTILDVLGMSHLDAIRTGLFRVEPRPITDSDAKEVIHNAILTVFERLPSLAAQLVTDRPAFVAMAMAFGLGCRTMWHVSKEMDSRTCQRFLKVWGDASPNLFYEAGIAAAISHAPSHQFPPDTSAVALQQALRQAVDAFHLQNEPHTAISRIRAGLVDLQSFVEGHDSGDSREARLREELPYPNIA